MRTRTSLLRIAVVALAVGTAVLPAAAAPVDPSAAGRYACPPAGKPLTNHVHWDRRSLSPGITLSETVAHDRWGRVNVHVLLADLGHPGVRVAPLHRWITSRHPLSVLARHRNLKAATNGQYFSYSYGAPFVPFIENGRAQVMSRTPQMVAGIAGHRAQSGLAWLDGEVRAGSDRMPLAAVNEPSVRSGLAVYTAAWGTSRAVPMWTTSRSRVVRHGRILSGVGRHRTVPRHGALLVASGHSAVRSLHRLHWWERVAISRHVGTDADRRFDQGYGVGAQVVAQQWQPRTHLYCRASAVLVARTAIGWSPDGRSLMLVVVGNPPGAREHGLDYDQMSQLMASFGVSQGFALDGGGSSEMVARLGRSHRLSVRNRPQDGRERPIPVGVGLFFRR